MRGKRGQQQVAPTALEHAHDLEHEIWIARKMWAHEPLSLKQARLIQATREVNSWIGPRSEIRKKGRANDGR